MRSSKFVLPIAMFILLSTGACTNRSSNEVSLTNDNQGLPQGWVWAKGRAFSIALPETTKKISEEPYVLRPYVQTPYTDRSDFNASYWDEMGRLIVYSVISCDFDAPIDSTQQAISIATELDQGLTDSPPLVMLQKKRVTIDGMTGIEFWRRTETREENFEAFLNQSPNEEVRKLREEGRPRFDKSAPSEKYQACVVLKDGKQMYLLVVKGPSGLKLNDSIVRPFIDHFKLD